MVQIEGENTVNTSTNVVYPVEDRSDALTSPIDTSRTMLNTIGTEKWETAGQWIRYRFSVNSSGMYEIYSRFKQSYLDATQQDIEIIKSPVGMPGRAIHSSFLDRVKEGLKRPKNCPFDCIKTCDVTHSPYCIMLALYNAFKGKLQNGYAFCGANAWRAEKIQSVRDLMASLKAEYDNFSLKGKLFGVK